MPTVMHCPHCGKQVSVPDNLMGKPVQCPFCNKAFNSQIVLPFAQPAHEPALPQANPPQRGPITLADKYFGLACVSLAALVVVCGLYLNRPAPEPDFPPFVPGGGSIGDMHQMIQQEALRPIRYKRTSPLYLVFGLISLASFIVFSGLFWVSRRTAKMP
jgi:hypothetical protein